MKRKRLNAMMARVGLAGLAALILVGCMGGPSNPDMKGLATDIDPATTQPAYWLAQPATEQISGSDFDQLWNACERVIRRVNFRIDRTDYRRGLLSSEPAPSRQFFELWRSDGLSGRDVVENSLVGTRRTLYFQFSRGGDESWTVAPKVLIERQTEVEQKLRGVTPYEPNYWYPTRRDELMEHRLAELVRSELAAAQPSSRP